MRLPRLTRVLGWILLMFFLTGVLVFLNTTHHSTQPLMKQPRTILHSLYSYVANNSMEWGGRLGRSFLGDGGSKTWRGKPWGRVNNLLPPGVSIQHFTKFLTGDHWGAVRRKMSIRERLRSVCEDYDGVLSTPSRASFRKIYQHILYQRQRDLVYCPVWKAMSTTWDAYFLQMSERGATRRDVPVEGAIRRDVPVEGAIKRDVPVEGAIKRDVPVEGAIRRDVPMEFSVSKNTRHYEMAGDVKRAARSRFRLPQNTEKAKSVIQNSVCSVMVVRHPLQRLVSTYRDKMVARNTTVRDYLYLRTIIKHRYRTNTSDATPMPTFREFVDFVLDEWSSCDPRPGTWREWSRDWHPAYYLCDPCHLNYSHILRYEHYQRDLQQFRQECGLEEAALDSTTHHHQLGNTTSHQLEEQLYGQLSRSQVVRLAQQHTH
ncbi:carbohydrate sulfotransferase 11 isoform X2 [Cherax quadricarinatus]|uniref:carbohydrate sulfotransferase 11 isoform X2 n=1 Tax=Cherax quadricarinatus TaxID=27406 RepID=UPI00387E500F